MPIGLIGSLAICTVFYILVVAGRDRARSARSRCWMRRATGLPRAAPNWPQPAPTSGADQAVVCSKEALGLDPA
jgi:hypothetical protein